VGTRACIRIRAAPTTVQVLVVLFLPRRRLGAGRARSPDIGTVCTRDCQQFAMHPSC